MTHGFTNEEGRLARRKRAELTGGLGAGVLGAGLGVALGDALQGAAVPLTILGGVMHAWGMWDKHRVETDAASPRLWWDTLLYWICWVLLVGLAAYLVGRRVW